MGEWGPLEVVQWAGYLGFAWVVWACWKSERERMGRRRGKGA